MSLNNLSEENKIFVSKLFGIKAGLSMISLEVDKIRNAETIMRKYSSDIENGEYTLSTVQERIKGFAATVEQKRVFASAEKKNKTKKLIGAAVWCMFGVLGIVAGIAGLIVGMVQSLLLRTLLLSQQ